MEIQKKNHFKVWFAIGMVILALTVGAGFYQNISAESDELYNGLKIFSDVIDLVEKNYVDPVDPKDLIEKAIQGMVSSLDPHSALLPPDAFKELQIDTKGKFTGIGIHITMRDGFVTVISPIEGTPAYKAGIKALDKIIKVDHMVTTDLRDAVNRMRGPKGTTVVVTIARENEAEPLEFTLTRDVIPIDSVKAVSLKPGYGYLWITNFREQTTDDVEAALESLESAAPPLKGLILDLRDNPGGILNQAISISDLFIDKGLILTIKGRMSKHSRTFSATPNKTKREYPIVVLINGGSASASEIVAGALQDHKRALILGTPSFGKGSVQTVETLRDGYGLKFTIARYYTPSGKSIQAKGVLPDITLAYKPIEDADEKAPSERLVKEKDLVNHLESRPLKDSQAKDPPSQTGKDEAEDISQVQVLLLERVQQDNQVMRALEILVSYEIFKDLNQG